MKALFDISSTIVAPATPINQDCALGIIRLSGGLALAIAQRIAKKDIFEPRKMHLCYFHDEKAVPFDQGLVVFFPGPFSATGEDVIEFHAHGNPFLLNALVRVCTLYGAQVAQPGEFLFRGFWHGKYSLPEIEGISSIIHGKTKKAITNGIVAITGEARNRLHHYADLLKSFRCQIESAIDFSDQEDVQDRLIALCKTQLESWILGLEKDLKKMQEEDFSLHGATLILIGPPNAGKSSLLNYLAGDDVSIVDDTAGTTRDLVRKTLYFKGIPISFCDTAGLRETSCRIEKKGIDKAQEELRKAGIIVFIQPDNLELNIDQIPFWGDLKGKKYLLKNKIDETQTLPGRQEPHCLFDAVFALSLKTGAGVSEWVNFLEKAILSDSSEETIWVANSRQQQYLFLALRKAKEAILHMDHIEIAAQLLQESQDAFSVLTGEILHDDLLQDIFSQFCIGK